MLRKVGKIAAVLAIPAAVVAGKSLLDKLAGEPAVENGSIPATQPTGEEVPLGGEIDPKLLEILVCPEDKGPLELVEDGKYLLNPRNGYRYPIRGGIPIMLIEEGKNNRIAV